jgi:4'-phosphopantetheinyl transferase
VRKIGAAYTGKTPLQLEVEVGERGKPYFINARDLHFNLSHSGEQVSVAFSSESVGLDLEKKERKGDFVELAKRFFHPEEQALLEKGGGDGARAFLELWTAKEAMLKLAGKGIAGGLEGARVFGNGTFFLESRRVFISRFELENHVGAVASFSPIERVREATF